MNDAWQVPDLTPAERLVLLAAQDNPGAPDVRIVAITGIETSIVFRALRELRRRGLIGGAAA